MKEGSGKEINHLVAYVLTSAAGCLTEPKIYGSMRLIDTASRIITFAEEMGIELDADLFKIRERIENDKLMCMYDEEGFADMVSETAVMITDVVTREE